MQLYKLERGLLIISFVALITATLIAQDSEPVIIWNGGQIAKTSDMPVLQDLAFSIIKPYEFDKDGYRFLHGVALAWHKGKLYASFGHNRGGENTDTEEARVRISEDGGKTWSATITMDPGDEPGLGVSHGVFLSHQNQLWAFHGAYSGTMTKVHTRAYILKASGKWEYRGVVVEGGFWPLQEPLKMSDGNWIMSGVRVANGYGGTDDPAAVAISHGDDLTRWDLVVIPKPPQYVMWGESAVIVDGRRVINAARFGARAQALVAVSEDCGRTWTESRPSNLPMATSKPYAGTLSTGQRYLVCTTTADSGGRRSPLTIAVSRPGENAFSRVFRIRDAVHEGPGESHPKAALSYPYAAEHAGKLYVGYSNSGGRGGNQNSAELAVISITSLAVR